MLKLFKSESSALTPIVNIAKSFSVLQFTAETAFNWRFVMPHVIPCAKAKFQIFKSVVAAILIFVVYDFIAFERSSKVFTHYKTMLKNIAVRSSVWMRSLTDTNVTIHNHSAMLKTRPVFWGQFEPFIKTFSAFGWTFPCATVVAWYATHMAFMKFHQRIIG